MSSLIEIDAKEVEARVVSVFEAANVSPPNAKSVAAALLAAEIDGQAGHGLSRVAAYAAQAASGKVAGHAEPALTLEAPGFLRVDAKDGFAFPALDAVQDALPDLARSQGIAAAAVFRSHHSGQLSRHVERLADAGLVALMVTNTPKAMAPWGGTAPLFGTNPIAFSAPVPNAAPLVIDLSLSKVARGKVMAAKKRGEPIPEGWALDQAGAPTTDADAALTGSMVPAGDAKGAALAMMVEVLAAAVTGALFSFNASSFFDADGPPPGVGHLVIAIAPGSDFGQRMATMTEAILAQDGTRLPGTTRLNRRAALAESGEISVNSAIWSEITALRSS